MDERMISAVEAARLMGLAVATLAKWRRRGAGPKGWVRLSGTLVVYPARAVSEFMAEREEATKRKGLVAV